MSVAVLTLTDAGHAVGEVLCRGLPGSEVLRTGRDGTLDELFVRAFAAYRRIVCVMACGIVVRKIASLIRSKHTDPAVVVVDDAGRFAISLLCGHEGGANGLAYGVAAVLGAEPVVTTGSDTSRRLIVGVGCRRGVEAAAVGAAVGGALEKAGRRAEEIRHGVSIRKKIDERGLREAFDEMDLPLLFLPEERINAFRGPYARSRAAWRNLGVRAVAEPCALLGGRRASLILRKQVYGRVTVALAEEEPVSWEA